MKSLQEQLREVKKVLRNSNSKDSESLPAPSQSKGDTLQEYKICPVCKCLLPGNIYIKHMFKKHGYIRKKHGNAHAVTNMDSDEFTDCPKCHKPVKKKNLKKHIRRIHEKERKNAKNRKKRNKAKTSVVGRKTVAEGDRKITPEDARKLRKAMEDTHLVQDKQIAEYLRKNPTKDEMGKFGVPQDKYRWGFYGSKSMQYDVWGKGDKEK